MPAHPAGSHALGLALITLRCLLLGFGAGLVTALVLSVLVLLAAGPAAASPQPDRNDAREPGAVTRGSLMIYGEEGFTSAPMLHTDVHMDVSGLIARIRVIQEFTNPGARWCEGIYVFPLPETAAVDHLHMQIGTRSIAGRIRERGQARSEYQRARAAGARAGLVEQERPNLFTASVANIGPGERITLEIEYQQTVHYDQGTFSLRFPLVAGPRYIPGSPVAGSAGGNGWAPDTDRVPDASRITPPVIPPGTAPVNPVAITVQLSAGFPIGHIVSRYHPMDVQETATGYRLGLRGGEVPADRDFLLEWQPQSGAAPRAAAFVESIRGSEYALLMLLPPEQAPVRRLSREIIFVIDTSGSMAGASISAARTALALALDQLQPGDRFNVLQFNSGFDRLFPAPVPVSAQSLERARRYVLALEAGGGTEMAPALRAALADERSATGLRQVIFITDGNVGNEAELFAIIERRLGRSRLFTIGIGSAPNSHFMRRAARYGRGTHTYIGRSSEVAARLDALFRKLDQPVLTGLTLDWPGSAAVESWPARLPDLYLGEPVLVSLKASSLPDRIRVSGHSVNGPWQEELSLRDAVPAPGAGVLWARSKIAALMDAAVSADTRDGIRQQVVATALEHHLVCAYTSLVAVEETPVRPQSAPLHASAMPVNLPAGWNYGQVFGAMPRTASPANWYLCTGLLLLLAGALSARWRPSRVRSRS